MTDLQPLEQRTLFAIYGPDVTFGIGGSIGAPSNQLLSVLPDHRIVTIGTFEVPPLDTGDSDPGLPEQHINLGVLSTDGAFQSSVDPAGGDDFQYHSAAFDGSRFYVTIDGFNEVGDIRAYTLDGNLDPTFGQDGAETLPVHLFLDGSPGAIEGDIIGPTSDGGVIVDVMGAPESRGVPPNLFGAGPEKPRVTRGRGDPYPCFRFYPTWAMIRMACSTPFSA